MTARAGKVFFIFSAIDGSLVRVILIEEATDDRRTSK